MTWLRILAILTIAAGLATSAQAGIIFGKKKPPPVDPSQRVPELLGIVKTSPDEGKRSQAANELRKYDPQAFPEIVPVLIDVLANDAKTSVRLEAAQSLGRIRPISQAAGQALEQALAHDASLRVRLQARSSLLNYYWGGYRSSKKDGPPPQTKEPPLAGPELGEPPAQGSSSVPPPPELPPQPEPPSRSPAATQHKGAPPVVVTTPVVRPRGGTVPVIRMTPVPAHGTARPLPIGPTNPEPKR